MKLFRRIFLQALLAVVIISQATLIYFLYEAQQQTVNDWRKNEQTEYTNKSVSYTHLTLPTIA